MAGTLFIVLAGCGLFLRLVAKEKRRRERHLLLRLEEKRKALEHQAEAPADVEVVQVDNVADAAADTSEVEADREAA